MNHPRRFTFIVLFTASSTLAGAQGPIVVGGDQPGAEVIGRVVAVAADDAGRVFILDGSPVSILVLSPAGRVAQRLRVEGDGPGELRRPTQMQVVDDRLYVLDGSRRRLSVFSIRDGLKPETDLAIPDPNARAFCAMGNAVHFLHGTADAVRSTERVGNTLIPRGTLARFEADHPLAANPMFTATMSFRGYLACFPKANRVLWVNIILGDVAAMMSAGEPPRRARFQAFLQRRSACVETCTRRLFEIQTSWS